MARIHLIAIGGSAMHNMALALHSNGHSITGSDDEIYEPAFSRLKEKGLLPHPGWHAENITPVIDAIILGMHAKKDNVELQRALELGVQIFSYPEFIYEQSKHKKRLVIAGSHGKTSTTSLVMHAFRKTGRTFDYLVGAQLEGFDLMVKLSDADTIIIEGDEYLSSPIDRVPKIHHYMPHVSIITGIAWDHINVFPTFSSYIDLFDKYIELHERNATVIVYEGDKVLMEVVKRNKRKDLSFVDYNGLAIDLEKNIIWEGKAYEYHLVVYHNLQNVHAAMLMCNAVGMASEEFLSTLADFRGASKRLQCIKSDNNSAVYLDFAHAPSKVSATTTAVKQWFGSRPLIAIFELHTFSSLNSEFLPQYKGSLDKADTAIVYFDKHTLEMKNMPELSKELVARAFQHHNLHVIDDRSVLHSYLSTLDSSDKNLLLMSSGNFGEYKF